MSVGGWELFKNKIFPMYENIKKLIQSYNRRKSCRSSVARISPPLTNPTDFGNNPL